VSERWCGACTWLVVAAVCVWRLLRCVAAVSVAAAVPVGAARGSAPSAVLLYSADVRGVPHAFEWVESGL